MSSPGANQFITSTNMADFGLPGVIIEVDPDEADAWGAFHEDALSEADAIASAFDTEVVE
jgi:hypothetical protein